MGKLIPAQSNLKQAFRLTKKHYGDRHTKAAEILYHLARVQTRLGKTSDALDNFAEVLSIYTESYGAAHVKLASVLSAIAEAEIKLQEYQKAHASLSKALAMQRLWHGRVHPVVAKTMGKLGLLAYDQGHYQEAVFYLKESVNLLQAVQHRYGSLSFQARKRFNKINYSKYYRVLASALVALKRDTEAQYVLNLLKELNYARYTLLQYRLYKTPLVLLPWNKDEKQWNDLLEQNALKLSLISKTLKGIQESGDVSKQKLPPKYNEAIKAQVDILDKINKALAKKFNSNGTDMGQASCRTADNIDKAGEFATATQTLQKRIKTSANKTVLLQYLRLDNRYIAFLTSATELFVCNLPFDKHQQKDVKILRKHLQGKYAHVRLSRVKRVSANLYFSLIHPLRPTLDKLGPKVILLSLDDTLQYIPFAALYDADNKRYLIQDFAIGRFDSVALDRETKVKISSTSGSGGANRVNTIMAFGSNKGIKLGRKKIPAMPEADLELKQLVRSSKQPSGMFPGKTYQNRYFSRYGFRRAIKGKADFIHIAGHMRLKAGSNANSILYLGNGSKYTTSGMLQDKLNLSGFKTITLSASHTAMKSPSANGNEVTGLGTQLMLQGTDSVLATLWLVNDISRSEWIIRYYRYLDAGMDKALAKQKVQLDFIEGRVNKSIRKLAASSGLRYRRMNYKHPHVWSAFVQMGK
jgi:CHAT domain-containing protein